MITTARRVTWFLKIEASVRREVRSAAVILMRQLRESHSLRSIARKTGLSPTYLCQVAKGKVECSNGAYLKLAKVCGDTSQ